PPPQASNGAAHMPMALSPAGTPVLVVPSASQAYPPLARNDRSVGNKLVIPMVLLAVALAIAAAVVLSLNPHFGTRVKIPAKVPPVEKKADKPDKPDKVLEKKIDPPPPPKKVEEKKV